MAGLGAVALFGTGLFRTAVDATGFDTVFGTGVFRTGVDADDALADALKAFVKDRLAPFKYPRQIEFIGELPKTATGKIQRFRLRERAAAAAR